MWKADLCERQIQEGPNTSILTLILSDVKAIIVHNYLVLNTWSRALEINTQTQNHVSFLVW